MPRREYPPIRFSRSPLILAVVVLVAALGAPAARATEGAALGWSSHDP